MRYVKPYPNERYANDPRWMTAKFKSTCSRCKSTILKNDNIYYYPATRSVYCSLDACGPQGERDFVANVQDEEFYNS